MELQRPIEELQAHDELDLIGAHVLPLLPAQDAVMLDIGCGSAVLTRQLLERFGSNIQTIIATEVDKIQHEKNLQSQGTGSKITFVLGGAEAIDLPDASIDAVFLFKSLHHVPTGMLDTALGEIHRVLKPNGVVWVSEPVFAGAFNEILRLFHDEQKVRNCAFEGLKRAIVNEKLYQLERELHFVTALRFADFAEFDQKVVRATHTHHSIPSELLEEVKTQFELSSASGPFVFYPPMRVDLLRKIEQSGFSDSK